MSIYVNYVEEVACSAQLNGVSNSEDNIKFKTGLMQFK
jgi:hypothetical protein